MKYQYFYLHVDGWLDLNLFLWFLGDKDLFSQNSELRACPYSETTYLMCSVFAKSCSCALALNNINNGIIQTQSEKRLKQYWNQHEFLERKCRFAVTWDPAVTLDSLLQITPIQKSQIYQSFIKTNRNISNLLNNIVYGRKSPNFQWHISL